MAYDDAPDAAPDDTPAKPGLRYSDDDILKLVGEERRRSIGFGEGDSGELEAARERALAYYRGDMSKDIASLPNRSSAVSTDIAEAIETALPDIVEIFVGGDDPATFLPVGPEDEERAQQETDFVNHVVFNEANGFLAFYTAFKDALLTRTGLFYWWWEDSEKVREERFEGKTQEELAVAQAVVQQQQGAEIEAEQREDGLYDIVIRTTQNLGKVCVKAVPPEDFTIAADAVDLRTATYCAMRDRPRVQDLIARGIDAEKARSLPTYGVNPEEVAQERDRAGESEANTGDGLDDLRQVEVRCHYIRLDANGDGQLELYRVLTDAEERIFLEKEEVDAIPFGALTPYLSPHRFYGESVADKLIEIQKIKTTLLRMMLDSGYFALNQRAEVDMSKANEFTISDLLRNEPNMPVRVKQAGAVTPITAGQLNFDIFGAIEHVSVMGEQRTGIVRNAQGLKPDTLHDTAKGALQLMSMAQKRIRFIARIFAETGVKDMFLGVHSLLRTRSTGAAKARLRGKWTETDPTAWGERKDMVIQVGLGSSGREQDLMAMEKVLEFQQIAIQHQGGWNGPLVTADNVHNAMKRFIMAAGQHAPELFVTDPKEAPPQEPKPDPALAEMQAKMQIEAGKAQIQAQADEARAQREHEREMQRMQIEAKLKARQQDTDAALRERQVSRELDLKERQLVAELGLKERIALAELNMKAQLGKAEIEASSDIGDVHTGGEPG